MTMFEISTASKRKVHGTAGFAGYTSSVGGSDSILSRVFGFIVTLSFVAVAAWLLYSFGPSLLAWLRDYVW
jgi:hypothetical protein